MKRHLVLLPALVGLHASIAAADGAVVRARAKPSVVAVLETSGEKHVIGSGFVVRADGLVATNFHVADHLRAPIVRFEDDTERDVLGTVALSPEHDLAILRIAEGTYTPVEFGDSRSITEGAYVAMIGNPHGLTFSFTEGIVSAVRPQGLPEELKARKGAKDDYGRDSWTLQITAPAAGGSSGSAVFDAEGRVVGIENSGYRGTQSLNFAIASHHLQELLAGVTDATPVEPFRMGPGGNLVISVVVLGGLALLLFGWERALRRRRRRRSPRPLRG